MKIGLQGQGPLVSRYESVVSVSLVDALLSTTILNVAFEALEHNVALGVTEKG